MSPSSSCQLSSLHQLGLQPASSFALAVRPYPEELITIALELLAFSFELLPSHHPLEESGQRHPVSKYIRQYNRQLKNQFKRALPAPPYDIIHRQQLLVRRSPLLTVPLATEVQVMGGARQHQLAFPSLKLRWPGDWPGNLQHFRFRLARRQRSPPRVWCASWPQRGRL